MEKPTGFPRRLSPGGRDGLHHLNFLALTLVIAIIKIKIINKKR
jgi:hypothetical protein